MIGLVVDSSSQMSAELADRFGFVVVPLTVTIDGVDYREGIDLDAEGFYEHWADGRTPEVSTSQPSPGAFAEAYERLVDAGAESILSIHITEAMSGTLNSARLAAQSVEVPVVSVDTKTASFGVACCAWAAADAIEDGADIEDAEQIAATCADSLRTSFVVGVPKLTDRSGRADGLAVADIANEGVPVLAMSGGDLSVLATVDDLDAAVAAMVDDTLSWPSRSPHPPKGGLRLAIGTSDESSRPVSSALRDRLDGHDAVAQIVEYRIGPSVGAHTGPGTAGLFYF